MDDRIIIKKAFLLELSHQIVSFPTSVKKQRLYLHLSEMISRGFLA